MSKFILASSSPRRIQILKDHGFEFIVKPANIDEEKYTHLTPLKMVKTLSMLKAEKVYKQNINAIVLAADTTVVLGKRNIGKPKNKKEAVKILSSLSNTKHKVITGFTIINKNGLAKTYSDTTYIYFKKLSKEKITDYVEDVNVLGFAGAYGVQDKADKFVKKIEGDYQNIVGLPTKAIKELEKIL